MFIELLYPASELWRWHSDDLPSITNATVHHCDSKHSELEQVIAKIVDFVKFTRSDNSTDNDIKSSYTVNGGEKRIKVIAHNDFWIKKLIDCLATRLPNVIIDLRNSTLERWSDYARSPSRYKSQLRSQLCVVLRKYILQPQLCIESLMQITKLVVPEFTKLIWKCRLCWLTARKSYSVLEGYFAVLSSDVAEECVVIRKVCESVEYTRNILVSKDFNDSCIDEVLEELLRNIIMVNEINVNRMYELNEMYDMNDKKNKITMKDEIMMRNEIQKKCKIEILSYTDYAIIYGNLSYHDELSRADLIIACNVDEVKNSFIFDSVYHLFSSLLIYRRIIFIGIVHKSPFLLMLLAYQTISHKNRSLTNNQVSEQSLIDDVLATQIVENFNILSTVDVLSIELTNNLESFSIANPPFDARPKAINLAALYRMLTNPYYHYAVDVMNLQYLPVFVENVDVMLLNHARAIRSYIKDFIKTYFEINNERLGDRVSASSQINDINFNFVPDIFRNSIKKIAKWMKSRDTIDDNIEKINVANNVYGLYHDGNHRHPSISIHFDRIDVCKNGKKLYITRYKTYSHPKKSDISRMFELGMIALCADDYIKKHRRALINCNKECYVLENKIKTVILHNNIIGRNDVSKITQIEFDMEMLRIFRENFSMLIIKFYDEVAPYVTTPNTEYHHPEYMHLARIH